MTNRTTRIALPILAAGALASPALAEVDIAAKGPIVSLQVTETVKARPDMATVSAGVTSDAPTAVAAMQANAREMKSVIDRIKALGIKGEDIQTTGINLNARYDYDRNTQKQVFRGYQASNRVTVILRDVDRTGQVLDALVAAGATDIGGPSFGMQDDTAAKAQARKAAMEKARGQAMEYAGWAGYSSIRLLEVNETIYSNAPQPMMRGYAMDAVAESTPVEPGLVGTAVTVSVTYEMVGNAE
ncbi:MAG: SIMPL domain-containing protein [Sphingomonadaceae bacterium]|nr:SIMPL domain-containing protein [Sphingomonadaceae bacterium]